MNERQYDEQFTQTTGEPMTQQQTAGQPLSTADMAGMSTQRPMMQEPQDSVVTDGQMGTEQQPMETAPRVDTPRSGEQDSDTTGPLFDQAANQELRARWDEIQTGFVDEPRQAVERADQLVAETMKRLAETFANERNNLENQWSQGTQAGTEELRVALRRYRAFFDRLLSI